MKVTSSAPTAVMQQQHAQQLASPAYLPPPPPPPQSVHRSGASRHSKPSALRRAPSFEHPAADESQQRSLPGTPLVDHAAVFAAPPPPRRRVCRNVLSGQRCPFGDRCAFSHNIEDHHMQQQMVGQQQQQQQQPSSQFADMYYANSPSYPASGLASPMRDSSSSFAVTPTTQGLPLPPPSYHTFVSDVVTGMAPPSFAEAMALHQVSSSGTPELPLSPSSELEGGLVPLGVSGGSGRFRFDPYSPFGVVFE